MTQQMKKTSRRIILARAGFYVALLATSFLTTWQVAEAQVTPATVTPANNATHAYTAPNGVPVVDIANPNASGLSHNVYTNYNVDSRGLVLNNGDYTEMARQSQLAGQVMANMNLTSEATVILNEVVAPNRSSLTGYTEVLGHSADVIVANPYGITCAGCGFINAPNATLTTGVPQINGAGALTGYAVDQGDILITGTGLNANNQNYLALIGRTIKLEGQINAKDLDIVAGANNWDNATKTATARTATGTAPTLAIDSSALGGMYANRIRLIATESGVGVKMLGEAAAGVDDFTLTANGKIELGGKISAKRDAKITSTASGADAIHATNARVYAQHDAALTASSGNIHLEGGSVIADHDLALSSASLTDAATTDATYADNNKRYGTNSLTLTQSGAASLNGVAYGSAGNVTGTFGGLAIGASGSTIYSNAALSLSAATDLALNTAALKSSGNLSLTATSGTITTTSGGAVQSTGGSVSLTGAALSNGGTISSDASGLTLRIGETYNSGTLHAKTNLDLADAAGGNTGTLTNPGTMLAENALTVTGTTIGNSGTLQGNGASSITATGLFSNSGTTLLGTAAGKAGTVVAGWIDNLTNGVIQSAGDLSVTYGSYLHNAAKIIGGGDLTVGSNATGGDITNSATGILQAADGLHVKKSAGANDMTFSSQAGTLISHDTELVLASITNSGTIQGVNTTATVANTFTNSGKYIGSTTGGTATLNAGTLANSGTMQSAGTFNVNIGSTLTNNAGAKLLGTGDLNIHGLTGTTYTVNNAGTVQAGGKLLVKGNNDGSAVTINGVGNAGAYIGHTVDMKAGTIDLADGSGITAGTTLALNAATLNLDGANASIVASNDAVNSGTGTITLSNTLSNNGFIYSKGNLTLSAPNITNNANGALAAYNTADLNATSGYFTNNGTLYAGSLLDVSAIGTFTNSATGTMNSDQDITATANAFTNNNDVIAGRNLTVSAYTIRNEIPGGDQRVWSDRLDDTQNNPGWSHDPDLMPFNGATSADKDHVETWHIDQSYSNGAPTEADKPRLIASGALTLKDFFYAHNLGGIISAPTVNINSSVGGAYFVNDSYDLQSIAYTRTWNDHVYLSGVYLYYSYGNNDTTSSSTTTTSTFGSGIYAGTLNASGFGLTNAGAVKSASVSGTQTSGDGAVSGTTGASTVTGASGASFGGITITLPSNPNGLFVVSQNPNSGYLIESNPKYGIGSSLSSQYMVDRLGLDPDNLQKRLGDGSYEESLIRDQITAQAGKATLVNGETEAAQQQRLMDNGVDAAKTLGLTYGVAPTAAQLAGLKADMVWMVETEVAGQKVLAPVVYLSAATKAALTGGAAIVGNDVNMNLASLTNTGGTIGGANTLNVTSKGDITNTSGTIKGGDVSLKSTEGSIVNQTYAHSTGNESNGNTDIGNTGTIESTGSLSLDAKKDIVNKGANMNAGTDASLKAGNNITFDTVENKQGSTTTSHAGGTDSSHSESSTTQVKSGLNVGGNLKTESGNDTTFAGTDVNVKGDADIKAGGNINVLSRDDKKSTSDSKSSGTFLSGSSSNSSETTTTNVGSTLNIGGNLKTDSGKDTTIQGSTVKVGGDGDIHAGGNLNVLDGQNTKTTHASTSNTGVGVGGGVYGTETETDDASKKDSVGSSLSFGGNAKLKSDKTVTVQGSDISSGGDMDIKGKDVKVLEGRNEETDSHSKSTTTFLKADGSSGDSSASSGSGASAGTDGDKANAGAHAEAGAEANGQGGVTLMSTETTTTDHSKSTGKASNIKSGGNMSIGSDNDTVIQGSNVEAGGDVSLTGKNVDIHASQDTETTKTTNSKTSVGLYGSSANKADAGANADANADGGGASASAKGSKSGAGAGYNAGDANADASAHAGAEASTDNTLDVMHTDQTQTTTTDVTHQGSSIKSGGKTTVKADDKLNVNGSSIDAGGDVDLKAKDMTFGAAEDSHTTTTTSSSTKAGLYAGAGADASVDANANAGVKGLDAGGSAGAEANANAGVGLYGSNTTKSSTEGSTHAVTSTIKSGGNMTRNADGNITDEGTQIESGGDFSQTSKTWDSKAAKDTTFSSSSEETNTAKLGAYGEANAGASASASLKDGAKNDSGADASVGVKASYDRDTSDESASSSHAVTSTIKSGGNMKTTTTGKASLEGTNLESGKDMELNAGSLDYKAAQDTSTSSSSSSKIGAELKVGVDATKAVTGTASGSYDAGRSTDSSTTAVTGGMKSGGNMKVNTTGDAHFEGTNLEAGGDAAVKSGGSLTFDAAHNTASHTEGSENASASISASKSKGSSGKGSTGMGLEAEGGFDRSSDSSSDAVTGGIKSGGKMDLSAGKDATFEGTNLESGGDMNVGAKGNVNFNAAKSTSSSESYGADASISASKGGKDKEGKAKGSEMGVDASGNYAKSDATTSTAGSLKSGGKVNVKSGNDTTLEGTSIESTGKTSINAGHDVNFKAAEDTSSSIGVSGGISMTKETPAKGEKKTGGTTTTTTKTTGSAAEEEKPKTEGNVTFGIEGGKSSTKTGGSIKAGDIDISAGHDATLEGTSLDAKGDTGIKAGNNVNLKAAESSHVDGSFSGGVGSGGASIGDAGVGGGVQKGGVKINTGKNLDIQSGGKTTLEGTKAKAGGKADINAAGGIEKKSTVSGGGQIGITRGGADIDVQQTDIQSGQ